MCLSNKRLSRNILWIGLLAFLISAALCGCGQNGYLSFWKQQKKMQKSFQQEPNAEVLRWLEPENCFLLRGHFSVNGKMQEEGPVLLVTTTNQYQKQEIVAKRILRPFAQYYQVYLPEGAYNLNFFMDIDKNGFFEAHEMIGNTSDKPIQVHKTSVEDGLTIHGPEIALNTSKATRSNLIDKIEVKRLSYVYPSLDDPFFDPEYGKMGMFNSKNFMTHTQLPVFALEEFNKQKTLVFFVHGAGGTPRDFKYLVEKLDRKKYYPLFYYYATGTPLQKAGSYLAQVVKYTATETEFQPKCIILVAHSMGGLVSLAAVNELYRQGRPEYLKGYISFDSPYGGVDSAKLAVEKAPVVVPAWRDIATGSTFLDKLYQDISRVDIPFYLFFGYKTGESSDGTIDLQSQLDQRVHLKALKSFGFNTTHVGILNDENSRRLFYQVLSDMNNNVGN